MTEIFFPRIGPNPNSEFLFLAVSPCDSLNRCGSTGSARRGERRKTEERYKIEQYSVFFIKLQCFSSRSQRLAKSRVNHILHLRPVSISSRNDSSTQTPAFQLVFSNVKSANPPLLVHRRVPEGPLTASATGTLLALNQAALESTNSSGQVRHACPSDHFDCVKRPGGPSNNYCLISTKRYGIFKLNGSQNSGHACKVPP